MRLLVIITALALFSCSAGAVDTVQKKPEGSGPALKESAAPASDSNAEKAKPSAEMKRLARLVGRWQSEEKYEVTPFSPHGGEGKGAEMIHRGPGGLSIVMNYRSAGTMGDYTGTGIVTWSPEKNSYVEFWVDSGAPGGELWAGNWEGEELVFTSTQKMGDQTVHWKQTLSFPSSDAFGLRLDQGPTDAAMKPFVTYRFTRTARQTAHNHRHGTGMHGRPNPDAWAPRSEALLR